MTMEFLEPMLLSIFRPPMCNLHGQCGSWLHVQCTHTCQCGGDEVPALSLVVFGTGAFGLHVRQVWGMWRPGPCCWKGILYGSKASRYRATFIISTLITCTWMPWLSKLQLFEHLDYPKVNYLNTSITHVSKVQLFAHLDCVNFDYLNTLTIPSSIVWTPWLIEVQLFEHFDYENTSIIQTFHLRPCINAYVNKQPWLSELLIIWAFLPGPSKLGKSKLHFIAHSPTLAQKWDCHHIWDFLVSPLVKSRHHIP